MSSETIVVQSIPLALIRPNPKNRLVTQDMIDEMAASLEAVGLKNPIKVRPLSDGTYALFSGHVRRAGAAKLGWERIDAYVKNITPAEAVEEGITDNRNNAQTWLDDYRDIVSLEEAFPDMTIPQLAARLRMGETSIKRGQRLLRCLNPESQALIDQCYTQTRATQAKISRSSTDFDQSESQISRTSTDSNRVWELTEDPVYQLTPLEDPEVVLNALRVLIDRHLTSPQVKNLVAWMQAGNPADSFNPAKAKAATKPVKAAKVEGAQEPHPAAHSPQPASHAAPATKTEPVAATPAAHSAKVAPVGDQAANGNHHRPLAQPSPAAHLVGDQQAMGSAETALYEALAGISVIAKIKTKIKKGERPSVGERFLLAGYDLWHGLMWLLKNGLKLAKMAAKWIKYLFKSAGDFIIGTLEFFGLVKDEKKARLVILVIVLGFSWWYVSNHDVGHTVHTVYSKFFPAKVEAMPSIPVAQTPAPQTAAKPSHKHKSVASVPTATPQNTAVVAQVTPTVVPKKNGDLVTQAAGAAPAVLQATDGVKKLFGF